MTRNYLRFLVEGIALTDEEIDISAGTDAALRLMAGRGEALPETKKAESVNPLDSFSHFGLWLAPPRGPV